MYWKSILVAWVILMQSCSHKTTDMVTINNQDHRVYSKAISDEISISYFDEGKGDHTLIFVHGLGTDKRSWLKNIHHLSKVFRCIAIDLPGYGGSSKGDFPYDMQFFSQVVNDFCTKMGIDNPILVGHSMGGQIVLKSLLHYPSKYQKAILISPAGIEQFSDSEKIWFKTIMTPELIKNTTDDQIRYNVERNFVSFPSDAAYLVDDRIDMKSDQQFESYVQMIPKCVSGMLDQVVYSHLSQVETQVLLIFGESDYLIPNPYLHKDQSTRDIAKAAKDALQNSELHVIEGCGHMVQWECNDQVNTYITEFVSDSVN